MSISVVGSTSKRLVPWEALLKWIHNTILGAENRVIKIVYWSKKQTNELTNQTSDFSLVNHDCIIIRAHSFPRPAEFHAEPRNLLFPRIWAAEFTVEFVFLPRNSAVFDVFHSNNYFFTENDLKVALLQVCLWWFFFMVMVEWWKWWLMNEQWRIHKFITCIWPVDWWFNQAAEI